jgi:Protein of unknown function (DUF4232)
VGNNPESDEAQQTCTGADLAVTVQLWNGADVHGALPVVFRNTSAEACVFTGYPGVAALGRAPDVGCDLPDLSGDPGDAAEHHAVYSGAGAPSLGVPGSTD